MTVHEEKNLRNCHLSVSTLIVDALTYALDASSTIIEIHSCIIIDTTVLSIGRRPSYNSSSTARISEASSELGLNCNHANFQYQK